MTLNGSPSAERPERVSPSPNGLIGVGVALRDPDGRVLLGLGHDGRWELPGGKVDPGERFEEAAAREVEEETGLRLDPAGITVGAVLLDGERGLTRVTAAATAPAATGLARVREPDKIVRWEWFVPDELPQPERLFAPSAAVLRHFLPSLPRPSGGPVFHRLPVGGA
ncbi:NUDIX domain-containing protein [Streptomyces sp. C10-9-1]|uniref:NUDIX domain-containing protein n=1 Tax=Streptomyces sp. C10-9-1 TaxID=1859285 RepID=UPI003D75FEE3